MKEKLKSLPKIFYRVTVLWWIGKRPPHIKRNSQNLCSGLLRNLDYILQYMYSYGDTKSFYSQLMSEADALLVNKKKSDMDESKHANKLSTMANYMYKYEL